MQDDLHFRGFLSVAELKYCCLVFLLSHAGRNRPKVYIQSEGEAGKQPGENIYRENPNGAKPPRSTQVITSTTACWVLLLVKATHLQNQPNYNLCLMLGGFQLNSPTAPVCLWWETSVEISGRVGDDLAQKEPEHLRTALNQSVKAKHGFKKNLESLHLHGCYV